MPGHTPGIIPYTGEFDPKCGPLCRALTFVSSRLRIIDVIARIFTSLLEHLRALKLRTNGRNIVGQKLPTLRPFPRNFRNQNIIGMKKSP